MAAPFLMKKTKKIPGATRGIVMLGLEPIIAVRSDGGDVAETNVVCRRRRTILELRVPPESLDELLALGFIPEQC